MAIRNFVLMQDAIQELRESVRWIKRRLSRVEMTSYFQSFFIAFVFAKVMGANIDISMLFALGYMGVSFFM